MDLLSSSVTEMSELDSRATGKIYSIALKISNLDKRVSDMHKIITDTSWLIPLNIIDRESYAARSRPTVDRLVKDILSKVENTITEELGEYLISDSAQTALVEHLNHVRAPLAELIKEKISGNPGFDFHTESPDSVIAFGEAKYSGIANAHGRALRQINDFIVQKKDVQEFSDLKNFFSVTAITNAASGIKSYCAAFSIVSDDIERSMKNALNSKHINSLIIYEAVYIIGVKISA